MPTTVQEKVQGYAHCVNPRCSGSRQEPVEAVRIEDSYTYAERGGDLPGFESSTVRFAFVDESQAECPACGRNRDLTNEPRPSYESLSGHSQEGLLDIEINPNGLRFDPQKQAEIQAEASDSLKQENAELREQVAELRGMVMAQMAGQQKPESE